GLLRAHASAAGLVAAGITVSTRMPSGPHSVAATRLSVWIAALADAYTPRPTGNGLALVPLPRLITTLPSRKCGWHARMSRNAANGPDSQQAVNCSSVTE